MVEGDPPERRSGIRLTSDETWQVLAGSHTGILTTLKADGTPVTLPIWFAALDHTICFFTPSRTKKVARIRRDPRASFLVESGQRWVELRAVHLSGRVEPVDDEPTMARIDAAMDEKYGAFRTARTEMPQATRDRYAARRFFRFVPGPRILTWDNSRIPLGAGS
jgi:PPOX class probable F420-dependent enzyme